MNEEMPTLDKIETWEIATYQRELGVNGSILLNTKLWNIQEVQG